MLGILVQLALSWIIVWFFEKKDLSVLGFRPTKRRISDFFLFILVTALCASIGYFIRMYLGERWVVNPLFTWRLLWDGLWYNIKSVLFEELIFRGVLLYILIRRTSVKMAILVSSIAFGIYHWFSFEILGQLSQMMLVFFVTGMMGALFAYAYAKTGSLYIPCAIHLGWNFTRNFVFSDANIGNGIFIPGVPDHTTTVSWLVFYVIMYLPLAAALVVNYLLLRFHPACAGLTQRR